jgi:luciferase family oxidoreductase group 1
MCRDGIKIGVLDFGLGEGTRNGLLRIQDTITFAQCADELGFTRFWLAEHHFNNPLLAWNDPTPLLPILAMHTKRIRIGTGGLPLSIHQPYRIASSFKLYNNMFKGRMDLGLVSGNSVGEYVRPFCNPNQSSFDDKYEELIYWLRNEDELKEKHEVIIPPYGGTIPELWSLSSSLTGIERAIRLETNFVRSLFHGNADLTPQKEDLYLYKERYYKKYNRDINVMLAVSGTCQDSSEKAHFIASKLSLKPELHVVGNQDYIAEQLLKLSDDYGISEFLWKDIGKNLEDKIASIENLNKILQVINHDYAS